MATLSSKKVQSQATGVVNAAATAAYDTAQTEYTMPS